MSSLGRTSLLSQQLNGQSTIPGTQLTAEERQTLLQERQLIDALLRQDSASTPRHAALSTTDLASVATGNNMMPPMNPRKRSYDAASTAAVMSRSVSYSTHSVPGQSVNLSQCWTPRSPMSIPRPSRNVPAAEQAWLSTSGRHMTSMPPMVQVDHYTSYAPSEFINSSDELPSNSASKRSRSTSLLTPELASPATSFVSGFNSSYTSSYRTDPSSIASPLLCPTSFQDGQLRYGASMSRQPSIASSIGLSRPFEQMMKRTSSNASQAFSTGEPMFSLDGLSQPESALGFANDGSSVYSFPEPNDLLAATGHVMSSLSQQTEYAEMTTTKSQIDTAIKDETSSAPMQRTSSNSSTSSSASRVSERRKRQIQNGIKQPLASKDTPTKIIKSEDSNIKVPKLEISRVTYRRSKQKKQVCKKCNEHPEGFHGAHELRRHMLRAHAKTQKTVWICQQPEHLDAPKRSLDTCKACTEGRHYNAYYNAAAHIRRAHFYPRPRGRRPRGTESRAGKTGGDKPPISELKEHGWIKSIMTLVPKSDENQGAAVKTSDSVEDDDDDDDNRTCFDEMTRTFDGPSSTCIEQQTWPENASVSGFEGHDIGLEGLEWNNSSLENFIGAGIILPATPDAEDAFQDGLLLGGVLDFDETDL